MILVALDTKHKTQQQQQQQQQPQQIHQQPPMQTLQTQAQPQLPAPQSNTSPQPNTQTSIEFRGTFQHLPPPMEQKLGEIPTVPEALSAEQQTICSTQVLPVGKLTHRIASHCT